MYGLADVALPNVVPKNLDLFLHQTTSMGMSALWKRLRYEGNNPTKQNLHYFHHA